MKEPFDDDESEENEDFLDELKMENEIKKMKLSLEHGMNLSEQLSAAELPPTIESKLLDYIAKFEEQFSKRKTIQIAELLGNPELKVVADIDEDNIATELVLLKMLLKSKSIAVESVNKVEDREMYRFITEELLKLETNDIQIEGLTHCYIYEEFHPNHDADVRDFCLNFLNTALDTDEEANAINLGIDEEELKNEVNPRLSAQFARLGYFRDAFTDFDIEKITIDQSVLFDDAKEATVKGSIQFTGNIENSADSILFDGDFYCQLKRGSDMWTLINFFFPGVKDPKEIK